MDLRTWIGSLNGCNWQSEGANLYRLMHSLLIESTRMSVAMYMDSRGPSKKQHISCLPQGEPAASMLAEFVRLTIMATKDHIKYLLASKKNRIHSSSLTKRQQLQFRGFNNVVVCCRWLVAWKLTSRFLKHDRDVFAALGCFSLPV